MRKIYHFLLQIYQKLMIQKIIRKIDMQAPIQKNSESTGLMQKGWEVFSSDYFFNSSISNYVESNWNGTIKYDSYGNWVSRDISALIMKKIIESENIQKIVTSYLGSDARLDDMYFWFKQGTPTAKSLSEGWHDDNVGHRLKFFICLDAGLNSSRTCFMTGTNKKLYKFNLVAEFKRFFISKDNEGSFGKDGFCDEVSYKKDTIVVLDTNGLHRGNYLNLPDARNCIIVEFANRFKSNAISGKAPCGPGQSPNGKILISTNDDELFKFPLIDQSILRKSDTGTFSYSISNLNL